MKRLLFLYILLLPLYTLGNPKVFKIDKLGLRSSNYPLKNWVYKPGDNTQWAAKDYNDSTWEAVDPMEITVADNLRKPLNFDGIGWFRLHFHIDSASLAGKIVGLKMYHNGASEVYLDGRKIQSFGIINGKDSTENYNPQNVPFTLPLTSFGDHVIAIRYANYISKKMESFQEIRGFDSYIGYVDEQILTIYENTANVTFIVILLFGIFIALSFIHVFLYLYHRATRSNLYFSIFTFSIALWLLSMYINITSFNVNLQLFFNHTLMLSLVVASYSMSGFNNELFSPKKLRFHIITAICAVCALLWIFQREASYPACLVLMFVVLFEIVFRKIPGARIIGTGILFFALFLLVTTVVAVINKGIRFDHGSVFAYIFLGLATCAVLSIPASISIYLAWSFSKVNKHLAVQLQQVQALSDKTIEQEQEKKRILENQKEDLEKEVAIRTSEVISQKEK